MSSQEKTYYADKSVFGLVWFCVGIIPALLIIGGIIDSSKSQYEQLVLEGIGISTLAIALWSTYYWIRKNIWIKITPQDFQYRNNGLKYGYTRKTPLILPYNEITQVELIRHDPYQSISGSNPTAAISLHLTKIIFRRFPNIFKQESLKLQTKTHPPIIISDQLFRGKDLLQIQKKLQEKIK